MNQDAVERYNEDARQKQAEGFDHNGPIPVEIKHFAFVWKEHEELAKQACDAIAQVVTVPHNFVFRSPLDRLADRVSLSIFPVPLVHAGTGLDGPEGTMTSDVSLLFPDGEWQARVLDAAKDLARKFEEYETQKIYGQLS